MDPLYTQNLRYKLQKRVGRLNSVSKNLFLVTLTQFWRFFDEQPTFVGIVETLLAQFPDLDETVEQILGGEPLLGETEEEAAAIGYRVLRCLAEGRIALTSIAYRYPNVAYVEIVREILLEPFYEYVDEQLDDQRAMLALLLRYKQRSEWFHRDDLWGLSQTERRGEKLLALDLYAYLYDQGIDFSIEPSSITGEVDLIAAQDTPDPLLLDAKVFDGSGRGKPYVCKAFAQIYTYSQQYNEPSGYLAIFNTGSRDLRFALRTTSRVPTVVYNHKTIFLVTIDIHPHEKPVSKRGALHPISITEEELTGTVSEVD